MTADRSDFSDEAWINHLEQENKELKKNKLDILNWVRSEITTIEQPKMDKGSTQTPMLRIFKMVERKLLKK